MNKLLALQLPGGQTINAPASVKTGGIEVFATMVGNALTILLIIGIIITLFMIVWSGIQWTSSQGNPQKIAAARGRLTWAVIGLVIQLSAFLIMALIGYFFKVNLLQIG